jgi:hypothetical protein
MPHSVATTPGGNERDLDAGMRLLDFRAEVGSQGVQKLLRPIVGGPHDGIP